MTDTDSKDSTDEDAYPYSRQRISIEYVVSLLGYERGIRFCLRHSGMRLPPTDRVLRFVRRHSIIAWHLHRHMAIEEIARKYKMPARSVRRIIDQHRARMHELRELNRRLEEAQARRDADS